MPELAWLLLFIAGLFVIEGFYIRHSQQTISEHVQRLTARMDKPMIAGIAFGLGALAMWFIYHFTSPPPA